MKLSCVDSGLQSVVSFINYIITKLQLGQNKCAM